MSDLTHDDRRRAEALFWLRFYLRELIRAHRAAHGQPPYSTHAFSKGLAHGRATGALNMAYVLRAIDARSRERYAARIDRIEHGCILHPPRDRKRGSRSRARTAQSAAGAMA